MDSCLRTTKLTSEGLERSKHSYERWAINISPLFCNAMAHANEKLAFYPQMASIGYVFAVDQHFS
jgi:hypothetical protein